MRVGRLSRSSVLAFIIAAAFTQSLAAQSVSGSISGLVLDQSGQVVPGAAVSLIDEQTGATRTTESNQSGAFTFSAVQPARYTVRIELSGFSPFERKNIVLPRRGVSV